MTTIELNIEQKSKSWLETRKKYITASDVAKLVCFIKNKKYFNTDAFDWFDEKTGKTEKKLCEYAQKAIQAGEEAEEYIKNRCFSNTNKYKHSGVFVKDDWLLASLDVLQVNLDAPKVIEIKFSTSEGKTRNSYFDFTHPAFYQIYAQMYVTGAESGTLVVSWKKEYGEYDARALHVYSSDEGYQDFLKLIPKLKEVYLDMCNGKNHFVDILPVSKKSTSIFYKYLVFENRRKALKEELKTIENSLKDMKNVMLEDIEANTKVRTEYLDRTYVLHHKSISKSLKKLKNGINADDVFDYTETKYSQLDVEEI